MLGVFSGCTELESLDLNNFNTSLVFSMKGMFENCIMLTNLKIDNFNISSVVDMRFMFLNCRMLPHLTINNFNGTNIVYMNEMFNGCFSLTSLNFNNFIVKNVKDMEKMFFSCFNLISLNLINFDTSLTTNMESMFSGCKSLIYLNINNFDIKNVKTMDNMFRNCISLTSLNLSSFIFYENTTYKNMFYKTAENLIYCMNDEFYQKIYLEMNNKKCAIRDINCIPNWNNVSKKLIADNGICIEQCSMSEKYKYEYENKCYSSCPKGTTSFYNNNYLCEVFNEIELLNNSKSQEKMQVNYTEQNIINISDEDNENTNDKVTNSIFEDDNTNFQPICVPNNFLKNECIPRKYDSMISMLKNDISKGLINDIIEDVINENKIDIYKEDDTFKYQITSSFNQNHKIYDNISIIHLEKCEHVLKIKYNINQNDTLLIFKYDYISNEFLAPIVGYEVFHPITKEILDLNYCKNNKLDIIIPINISENEIYKSDPNNIFYKDKCISNQNEKGVDMTIYNRKKEYNNKNLALCAINCEFEEYNETTKKVKCICEPQINSSFIKCFKKFFSLNGFKHNIGSYILLCILLINVTCCILFFIKEYKVLNDKINKIIDNYKEKNIPELILNNPIKKSLVLKKGNNNKNKKQKNNNSKIINSNQNSLGKINNNNSTNLKLNENNQKEKEEKKLDESEKSFKIYESELNIIDYSEAKKLDKRSYIEYYFSLVKTKHPLISSFLINNDYNSVVIKICVFFFSFAINFIVNSLFFTDKTMYKIYEDEGIYNFIYNLPSIIYSTIISIVFDIFIKKMAFSEDSILDIKKRKNLMIYKRKWRKQKKIYLLNLYYFLILALFF